MKPEFVEPTGSYAFAAQRERMVREQLEARDITDARVLRAMRRVPRHLFVPPQGIAAAYEDRPLEIGQRQTISQPYMVAWMMQRAELTGRERVLEVGTGSGYAAAVLAELAQKVVTIERHGTLAAGARRRLVESGYEHVQVVVGDGSEGYAPLAPYDRILVAAAAPEIPAALVVQLAPEGRLILPVGQGPEQTLTLVTRRQNSQIEVQADGPCAFVPLIGAEGFPDPPDAIA